MNKHFDFRDRVLLQNYIGHNSRGSAIEVAELLGKAVSSVYYELKHNMTIVKSASDYYGHS